MENLLVNGGSALMMLVVASVIVEALTESTKVYIESRDIPLQYISLFYSLLVCVLGDVNILHVAGIHLLEHDGLFTFPVEAAFVGDVIESILTGVVVSRGSGWTNDVLGLLGDTRQRVKNPSRPSLTSGAGSVTLSLESVDTPDAEGEGRSWTSVVPSVPSSTSGSPSTPADDSMADSAAERQKS